MTLQATKGGAWIPNPGEADGPSFTNVATLTASTHKYAFITQVPKTGSIHKIHSRYGTVSVGGTTRMTARVETVDTTTGDPTGTAYGGMATGTASAAPTSSGYEVITLGTDATATRGDFIAVVFGYGTFNASDSVIYQSLGIPVSLTMGYVDVFTAAWSKAEAVADVAIEYSDGSFEYVPGTSPYTTSANTTFNSGTAGSDEYALSFQLPFPCRVNGCMVNLAVSAATQNYELNLYSGTTALQTITVSHRFTADTFQRLKSFIFPTPQAISANTKYYLSVRPTSTTNVVLQIYTYNSAAVLDQDEGGQNFCLGTRLDQGAWAADTTTQRPAIFLLLDQFDDGVGGSAGLKIAQGMTGGCSG